MPTFMQLYVVQIWVTNHGPVFKPHDLKKNTHTRVEIASVSGMKL